MNKPSYLAAGAAMLILSLAASTARADDLPSPAELQAMQAAKDWANLLKATTRVLALKGPAAEPYDRPELWLQKAESQLNLKLFIPASDSFLSASKEPTIAPDQADYAYAMSIIARKSDARGYRPQASKENSAPPQMPILEPAEREAAFASLFAGELAEAKKTAEKANNLALAGRLVKQAQPVRRLARVAEKSEDKVIALIDQVLSKVGDDAAKWVDEATTRVDQIETDANVTVIIRDANGREFPQRKGPTSQEQSELKSLMKRCESFANDYQELADAIGEVPDSMSDLPKRVERLFTRAKTLSSPNYRIRGAL